MREVLQLKRQVADRQEMPSRHDQEVLSETLTILSRRAMRELAETDFELPWSYTVTHPVEAFERQHQSVEYEFDIPELETVRAELRERADQFLTDYGRNVWTNRQDQRKHDIGLTEGESFGVGQRERLYQTRLQTLLRARAACLGAHDRFVVCSREHGFDISALRSEATHPEVRALDVRRHLAQMPSLSDAEVAAPIQPADQARLDELLTLLSRSAINRIAARDFELAWHESLLTPAIVYNESFRNVEHRFNDPVLEEARARLERAVDDFVWTEAEYALYRPTPPGFRYVGWAAGEAEMLSPGDLIEYERRHRAIREAATTVIEAHDAMVERAKQRLLPRCLERDRPASSREGARRAQRIDGPVTEGHSVQEPSVPPVPRLPWSRLGDGNLTDEG